MGKRQGGSLETGADIPCRSVLTVYWTAEPWFRNDGEKIQYAASNELFDRRVAPGDVTYVLRYESRQVHFGGRIFVGHVLDKEDAVRQLQRPDLWQADAYILATAGKEETLTTSKSCLSSRRPEIDRFRACWATQAESGRLIVPTTGTRLVESSMKNKTLDRLQEHRLDREEVAGQHSPALRPQQLGPGRAGATRGRSQPGPAQDPPDRARSDSDPQLAKLALDPHASPARILPSQAHDLISRSRDPERADPGLAGGMSTCA
jgi:hypothetical protein